MPSSDLSGVVFEDFNNNGTQEEDEPGVAGALVILRQAARLTAMDDLETRTNEDGVYFFPNIEIGSYQLGVLLPPEYGIPDVQWSAIEVSNSDPVVIPPISAAPHWSVYLPMLMK